MNAPGADADLVPQDQIDSITRIYLTRAELEHGGPVSARQLDDRRRRAEGRERAGSDDPIHIREDLRRGVQKMTTTSASKIEYR